MRLRGQGLELEFYVRMNIHCLGSNLTLSTVAKVWSHKEGQGLETITGDPVTDLGLEVCLSRLWTQF